MIHDCDSFATSIAYLLLPHLHHARQVSEVGYVVSGHSESLIIILDDW
jgi:hypothetical protein